MFSILSTNMAAMTSRENHLLLKTKLKAVTLPSPAVEYDLQVEDEFFVYLPQLYTVSVHPNPRAFNLFMGMNDVKNVVQISP